jgi:hypothetical protein
MFRVYSCLFHLSGISNDMHFIHVKNRELNKSTIKSGNILPGQQEVSLLFE